ncbi:BREX-2 system phosphatase PglZ [Microbacterium terregens]|uniref:BREX-2 system phosphatase PglZ n=1 Tax=Microbacterium terregens TaxID=69363 RepID=A0ABV5T0J0_9MICO
MAAPTITETALRQYVDAWLSSARRQARMLLVRGQPRWAGPAVIVVRDTPVRVVEGVSGMAALDAMRAAPDNGVVVVLTSLTERELGSAVVLDAHRQRVSELDEWSMVPGLFGVRDQIVPRHVHDLGAWVPGLLMSLRPDRGFPPAPGAVLTPDHVVRSLIVAMLGLSRPDDLDLVTFLTPLDDPGVRARLRELAPETRESLIRAASTYIGAHFGLALRAAVGSGHIAVTAIGLVVGELWASGLGAPDGPTAAARVRIEPYIGTGAPAAAAQRFGDASRRITLRLLADAHGREVLEQAEALCAELDWVAGAEASDFLPAGLRVRVASLAAAIEVSAASPGTDGAAEVERAFATVERHHAASTIAQSLPIAAMAVRLVRWLSEPRTAPANFSAAVEAYAADGAWVERALGDIWDGDHNAALARAYGALAHTVQLVRREQDRIAAGLLTGAASADGPVPGVENLLAQVVVPLTAQHNVLLVVLDGMSFATATELAPELPGRGWSEIVRSTNPWRGAAVAALPTITEYSRTSLFAGELRGGNQQTEKSRFAAVAHGIVFHKDDLRSDAGHALPPTVTDAIADPGRKLVGVVLNTIDDALATAEVDSLRWHIDQIANLSALLAAARDAGRIVILTSDHGHMVERGSELRSAPGAVARFRDPATGAVQGDEVLVSGPRVLVPGGVSVLAVSDGVRFAAKKAGYHGGAAMAEIAIPIVVIKPNGVENPVCWVDAPPQEPVWWNEPVRAESVVSVAPAKSRARKQAPAGPALFDELPATPAVPAASLAVALDERLVSSETYLDRQRHGGRHPIEDQTVRAIVSSLLAGGGRAHRDTIAVAAGVAATSLPGLLASLRRLLNVDGYPVIELDADQVTVTLDESLLREQFGLGSQR